MQMQNTYSSCVLLNSVIFSYNNNNKKTIKSDTQEDHDVADIQQTTYNL